MCRNEVLFSLSSILHFEFLSVIIDCSCNERERTVDYIVKRQSASFGSEPGVPTGKSRFLLREWEMGNHEELLTETT